MEDTTSSDDRSNTTESVEVTTWTLGVPHQRCTLGVPHQRCTIKFYSAEWCFYCKNIKPTVFETLGHLEKPVVTFITKDEFKLITQYIPYFEIYDNENNKDNIQTSDPQSFKEFIHKYIVDSKLDLDSDF